MKQLVTCEKCGGDGWYIGSANNTYYDAEGEPVHEQVPIQVQCEYCHGEGKIEIDIT